MINLRRRTSLVTIMFALFIASIVLAHRPDDWAKFDHRTFRVAGIPDANSLQLDTGDGRTETIKLCGIDADPSARAWLMERVMGRDVWLILETPQTRDVTDRLRAFVFLDNQNLNLELVASGLAFADRREKTVMDGLFDPAESVARKKKLGIWYAMTDEQLPAWRKAWLRSLPGKSR